jgi:uncharacterized protein YaaW (UPF0174 family)
MAGEITQLQHRAPLQVAIQAAGFAPYKLAVIVANGMASTVLGHGLDLLRMLVIQRGWHDLPRRLTAGIVMMIVT